MMPALLDELTRVGILKRSMNEACLDTADGGAYLAPLSSAISAERA